MSVVFCLKNQKFNRTRRPMTHPMLTSTTLPMQSTGRRSANSKSCSKRCRNPYRISKNVNTKTKEQQNKHISISFFEIQNQRASYQNLKFQKHRMLILTFAADPASNERRRCSSTRRLPDLASTFILSKILGGGSSNLSPTARRIISTSGGRENCHRSWHSGLVLRKP